MFTFNKSERISKRSTIQQLYKDGATLKQHPYRVIWMPALEPMPYPAAVLVTCSKKIFKRAVDRNRIKRLTKEAYRKHKYLLYQALQDNDKQIIFVLNYVHTVIPTYSQVEKAIEKIITELIKCNKS